MLVCFDRPVQYEAELVHLQEVTGARIVQRTAVFGQVRLFAERRVVVVGRPALDRSPDRRRAARHAAPVRARTSTRPSPTACSTSPCTGCRRRASAPRSSSTSRTSSGRRWTWRRSSTPRTLSITNRQHFPALFASLQQHDLATLVTADGSVMYLGVGLRSSAEAERAVDSDRGMRHRSAQRFSYDHPSTTIAVVSDNGPVTIFRQGRAIGLAGELTFAGARIGPPRPAPDGSDHRRLRVEPEAQAAGDLEAPDRRAGCAATPCATSRHARSSGVGRRTPLIPAASLTRSTTRRPSRAAVTIRSRRRMRSSTVERLGPRALLPDVVDRRRRACPRRRRSSPSPSPTAIWA